MALAQDGAEPGDLAVVLATRSSDPLLELLADADHKRIRQAFVSFGCCGVTEPLDELAALGLRVEDDA